MGPRVGANCATHGEGGGRACGGEGVAPGKMARVSATARVGARRGISAEKRFAAGRGPALISYMLKHVSLSPHTRRCGNMEEKGTIADKNKDKMKQHPATGKMTRGQTRGPRKD